MARKVAHLKKAPLLLKQAGKVNRRYICERDARAPYARAASERTATALPSAAARPRWDSPGVADLVHLALRQLEDARAVLQLLAVLGNCWGQKGQTQRGGGRGLAEPETIYQEEGFSRDAVPKILHLKFFMEEKIAHRVKDKC